MVTYLSYFCGPDSPGYQFMINWVTLTVPSHTIINFTTDWLDGSALVLLVNTLLPNSIIEEDGSSTEEKVASAMNAAEKELGVVCTLTPKEFVCSNTEEILRMAYITQFINLKKYPSVSSSEEIVWPMIQNSSSGDDVVAPTDTNDCPSKFIEPISENTTPVYENDFLSHEAQQEAPEKFELEVHHKASLQDNIEVFDRMKEVERGNREKRKSELDELFAAAELDFDLVLKEIDEIGKTNEAPPPSADTKPTESPVIINDANNSVELELEFDFSSNDGETSSDVPSHCSPNHKDKQDNVDGKEEEEDEEIIQVSYTMESRSQLSTTTSPEPLSEHFSSATPSQSPSLSPIPLPVEPAVMQESVRRSSMCFPDRCTVEGQGLVSGIVDQSTRFIVDCSNAGRGRLEVIIETPRGENLEANGEQLHTNVFRVSFTPFCVGPHKISILFSEEHVPQSPFVCQVSDPNACVVSGLTSPAIGKQMEFKVDTSKGGPGSLQAVLNGSNKASCFQLVSCLDGVCTYHFVVDNSGEYSIDITWAGQHIKGSPFRFSIPEPVCPEACVILDSPSGRFKVGDEIKFRVDTHGAGNGELKAMLVTAKSESICNISVDDEARVYTVSVRPTEVGKHQIILQYGGEELPQSPLQVVINNPKLIIFDSTILPQPLLVNKPIVLPVNTKNCGDGLLSVRVKAPNGIEHAKVQHQHNNSYTATYVPTTVGSYTLELYYDNHPCLSKPLILHVTNPQSNITLTIPPPNYGNQYLANKTIEFHVHAPGCDPALLKVSTLGIKTGVSGPQPQTSVISNGNDNYTIQFCATKSDDFKTSVTYNDVHLNGSPFILPVRSAPRASKVSMFDPVIPLSPDQPIELVFDTSQAGRGKLAASSVNSKGKTMPVYVEQVNDDMYRVAFIPQVSDTFMVTVLYADKHINGSPFRVLYKKQEKTPPVCVYFEPDSCVQGLMGAAVYGRNSGRQEATVVQYQRSKYQVSFYPSKPDIFDLHVYWFDQEIKGSPFEIDLLGLENESSNSLVDSIPYTTGDKVGMLAATAVGRLVGPVPVHLTIEENDSCTVNFSTQRKDVFDINLFWNGKPLSGMPVHLAL